MQQFIISVLRVPGMLKRLKRIFPVHSLIFGLYPVLALMATNRAELQSMAPILTLRSLILSGLLVMVLYLICWPIARSAEVGAVITSLTLILFYSYGHVENLISQREINTAWLLPLWGVILVVGSYLILRAPKQARQTAKTLTIIGAVLIMFPLFDLVSFDHHGRQITFLIRC